MCDMNLKTTNESSSDESMKNYNKRVKLELCILFVGQVYNLYKIRAKQQF
jgi:hypothetical protein